MTAPRTSLEVDVNAHLTNERSCPSLLSPSLLQTVHHCNTSDAAALAPYLVPGQNKVTMVLLESPTNPMLKIADIAAVVAVVRAGAPVRRALLFATISVQHLTSKPHCLARFRML